MKKLLILSALLLVVPLVSFAQPAFAARRVVTKPVISSFTATPKSITQGQSSTLSWNTSGAATLTIDQGVGAVFKSTKVVTPTVTTVYTLTAVNSAGTTTATTSVTVTAPLPKPTCTLAANPTSISAGGSATLSFTSTNAISATLSSGIGAIPTSGSVVVTPATTTTYVATVTGTGGTASCSATLTVIPLPKPTCTLVASPASITVGSTTSLTWTSNNATSASINQSIGPVATSGTLSLAPTTTTSYAATFASAGGTTVCNATVTVTVPVNPNEIRHQAYTTSYSYWDNTPAGSALISHPILHSVAGGIGTYADPITIAVGHSIINNVDILDFPAGTRFYIPNVRRYFIVEDTCGDGATPQNGACHTGYPAGTTTWLDMWIDGASGTTASVDACAAFLTDTNGVAHLAIQNPASNYVVVTGPVFQNGSCTAQYGNIPLTL